MKCATNRCRTSVFDELNRGLNQLMKGSQISDAVTSDDPRLTLLAFDNRYVVECDLPGVPVENVTLQIEDNILTISGKRVAPANDEKIRVLFNERPGLEFLRKVQLARDVDQSAVDAEMTNGVLRITISKRSEVLPRKIEIKRQQAVN